MIRSKNFWIGLILFSIIPILLIDITEHSINWQKEVREEVITVVQNGNSLDKQEKAVILDRLLERNQALNFLIYTKSFAGIVLIILSCYFFSCYKREPSSTLAKSLVIGLVVIVSFILVKLFLSERMSGNDKINILTPDTKNYSLEDLHNTYYKDKVLYVDFWGTTCGPCLQEFRNFMEPLKNRYASNQNIRYLYIAQGNQYIWKQQLKKYQVEGDHLFLDDDQYIKLYKESVRNDSALVTMPRYLVLDKKGKITVTNARRPSDRDSLYIQLDKYLLSQ